MVSLRAVSAGFDILKYFQALRGLGFHFVCAGEKELRLDPKIFQPSGPLELIASNVSWAHLKPFYLFNSGGISMAVLSVVSPERVLLTEGVQDPLSSLMGLLPDLRGRVNTIVLYAFMKEKPLEELLKRLQGVDLVIIGGIMGYREPRRVGNILLMGAGGQWVATVDLVLQSGALQVVDFQPLHLSEQIPKDPQYTPLEAEARQKLQEDTCRFNSKESDKDSVKIPEEFKKLLEVPPEEAIRILQQQRPFGPSR